MDANSLIRQLPVSVEAEQALLGALGADPLDVAVLDRVSLGDQKDKLLLCGDPERVDRGDGVIFGCALCEPQGCEYLIHVYSLSVLNVDCAGFAAVEDAADRKIGHVGEGDRFERKHRSGVVALEHGRHEPVFPAVDSLKTALREAKLRHEPSIGVYVELSDPGVCHG